MGFLGDYWLAIIVSGAAVFIVSSIIHMGLQWHKGDYGKLAGEDEMLAAMREHGVGVGHFMFPCPGSMKAMAEPEMQEKYKQGPVGFMTVMPSGVPTMGKSLGQWFAYSVLVAVFAAYVLSFAGEGSVFRLTSTVAFIGFGLGAMQDSIWKGVSWSITGKFLVDGLLYGLTTGCCFHFIG